MTMDNGTKTFVTSPAEVEVMRRFVKKGAVVFDVGANVGNWSAHLLQLHPEISVHTFEPVPDTNATLRQQLAPYLASGTVTSNCCGVGRTVGSRRFTFYRDAASWSTFYRRVQVEQECGLKEMTEIEVPVTTLDAYCDHNGIRRIDFLKIDTEGAELDVLLGAQQLLKWGRIDHLQFEYGGTYLDSGITLREVFDLLHSHRYGVFRTLPGGVEYCPVFREEFEDYGFANYLAVNERLLPSYLGLSPKMLDLRALLAKHHIRPRGVIHIGAHEGKELERYVEMGVERVLFVEANPEVYQRLQQRIGTRPGVIAAQCAIADHDGVAQLRVTSMDQSSSVLPLKRHREIYPGIVEQKCVAVPCRTLDTLMAELQLDPRDYNIINIDIQGAELLALAGARQTLPFVEAINSEVNFEELYEGCARIWELDEFLDARGFERVATVTPYDPSWGDGLYVKYPLVTMSSLGANGRFANQLFQYAFLRMYSREHLLRYETPRWIGQELFGHQDPQLSRSLPMLQEKSNLIAEALIPNTRTPFRYVDFRGHFQYHTSYYAQQKELFRSLFEPVPSLKAPLDRAYAKLAGQGKTVVGLHLRRGDYGYGYFFVPPNRWYLEWLQEIWPTLENPVLYIASDEPETVLADFAAYRPVTAASLGVSLEGAQFYPDFYILSRCDIVAISNSSFSFAACMLNRDGGRFLRPSLSEKRLISFDPWNSEVILRDARVEDETSSALAPAVGEAAAADDEVRLSFVIIVLNGMPFLEYCINALYDVAHEIIVVEGAVETCLFAANPDGSSTDGTVQHLKTRPDPQGKLRLIQGRWPEKVHMQNAALERVTGNYVWLVDSDEIYKRQDLRSIKRMLQQDRSITQVNFIPDNFWKNLDTLFVSPLFYETGCHYRRLFKFVPGARFTTHRPPTMVWPGSSVSTEEMHLVGGEQTRALGIIIYHYSYVLNEQVAQKIELYNRYGWGAGWQIDLNEWYRECFLKWTPQNARELEQRYPVWTGDRNSRSVPFTRTHPEDMQEYLRQTAAPPHAPAAAAPQGQPEKRKGLKVAGDYAGHEDLTRVATVSEFAVSITRLFREQRPTKIIETGTYHGEGTTRVIASTLGELGIHDATFFSIECNPHNHAHAVANLRRSGLLPLVQPLHGLSTPRAGLPTYQEIEEKYVRRVAEQGFDDIFIDHQEHERALLYYRETDFAGIPEDLLGTCLAHFGYRPDFVLLDSGGHMGNIEFNYLIEKLQGPCFIALDDIYHIKHHHSFQQMQKDPRFRMVVSSKEKFGFCIARFTPAPGKRILWLRPDSIGDGVLASSMLPHLKEHYAGCSVAVLCQEHLAELYEASPVVDQVITFNLRRVMQDEQYRDQLLERLRGVQADLTLNSLFSRTPLYDVFAIASGAPQRIAMQGDLSNISAADREETDRGYTHLIASEGEWRPELERHRDFLRGLGIDAPPLQPVVWTSAADDAFADDFFKDNALDPQKTLALFAGAQYELRVYTHYGTALAQICREQGLTLVAFGSAAEYDLNQHNLDASGARGINLSGKLSLRQTAALVRKCRLAVGAETGTAHISCAVGTPNVVLLGGGHYGRFMPYSPLTTVACLPLACFRCNWSCRYSRPHCVKDVHPEVIAAAVRSALQGTSDRARVFCEEKSLWRPMAGEPAWRECGSLLAHCPVETVYVAAGSPLAAPQSAQRAETEVSAAPGAQASRAAQGSRRDLPKISLVIPSYNYGHFLDACLDSIVSQDYPNLELIIMDGGSTDNTLDVIRKYQRHITHWQSAPDGGNYDAINEGFKKSSGEIMAWLNADDMFHAGAFSLVSSLFREDPRLEWIMGRPNCFDEGGRQKHVVTFLPLNSRAKYLADQEFIQQEGVFWRRSLWERAGSYIRTDMKLAADLELWARFFRHAPLHSVDTLIAGFRDHPNQKSKDKAGYTAEATVVLARERELFAREQSPFSPPAPLPILVRQGATA